MERLKEKSGRVWTILIVIIVFAVIVFSLFSGLFLSIGHILVAKIGAPGIEIVNDTDELVRVTSEREYFYGDGTIGFSNSYCFDPMGDTAFCRPASLSPGESAIQTHTSISLGDKVQFLVRQDLEQYLEDEPMNFGGLQGENYFLCYQMNLSDAEDRRVGLGIQRSIYSFNWSGVLKYPAKCE